MLTSYDRQIQIKLGKSKVVRILKKYFSHKILYTEVVPSKKFKNSFLNKYMSMENSYIKSFCGDEIADFNYNCMIFYILQKMTDRDNCPTQVLGTLHNGIKIVMPTNYEEFRERVADVVAVEISFYAGEARVKYHLSVDNFMNIIKVSIRKFHPEELTSSNILKLLTNRINEGIGCIEFFEANNPSV